MAARRPLERWAVGGEVLSVVDTGRALVIAGAPRDQPESAVIEAARARGRAVVFFGVEPRGPGDVAIGQEPVWSLARWPDTVRAGRTLRSQIRRAEHKGVTIARRTDDTADAALDALVARWLRTRTLPPLGFVVDMESAAPYAHEDAADLVLVARAAGAVVGLLVARSLPGHAEALIEHVLRDPTAPNGTGEALVDHAFRALAADGFTHATLGLAPLRDDPRAPLPRALARVRDVSAGLFDWRGLDAWKEKLRPDAWRPLVIRGAGLSRARAVLEVLVAFAHNRPLAFALRALLHGPPLFFRALAALLVPWTVGVATVDARHFPGAWARGAWVVFDLLITVSLFALAYRLKRRSRRRWLHRALAVAVSLDAAITAAQALCWNLPRAQGAGDVVLAAIGCAAPALVATVLWTSLAHRA